MRTPIVLVCGCKCEIGGRHFRFSFSWAYELLRVIDLPFPLVPLHHVITISFLTSATLSGLPHVVHGGDFACQLGFLGDVF